MEKTNRRDCELHSHVRAHDSLRPVGIQISTGAGAPGARREGTGVAAGSDGERGRAVDLSHFRASDCARGRRARHRGGREVGSDRKRRERATKRARSAGTHDGAHANAAFCRGPAESASSGRWDFERQRKAEHVARLVAGEQTERCGTRRTEFQRCCVLLCDCGTGCDVRQHRDDVIAAGNEDA